MLSLSIRFRSFVLITFAVLVSASDFVNAGERPTVEVFTITDLPIDTDSKVDQIAGTVDVYEIDGIKRFEVEFSIGLPDNADVAKRKALERIGQLNERQMQRVQRVAMGLSKAMQYGIDRYPAIVFDGEVVVYGLTDLSAALARYQAWQAGVRP